MTLKKTVTIWVISFCATFLVLNFGFLTAQISSSFGMNKSEEPALKNVAKVLEEKTYSFPISENKQPEPIAPVIKTAIRSSVSIGDSFVLEIDELGIKSPIILEPSTDLSKVYKSLEGGVVHYSSTPLPGEWGTSIILGHSSKPWGYKGSYAYVFSELEQLNEGATFEIIENGQTMTFKISRKIIFNPEATDEQILRDFEQSYGKSVILMTCWPTGSNSKRIAVRGDLME